MSVHMWPLIAAIAFFVLLANVLAAPWIIYQYRKHGYFNFWRSLVLVSFLFYLMTAYFLVILPIPDVRDNCVDMTNAVYSQLRPFQFIHDIKRETGVVWSSLASYTVLLRATSFYQVVFNVFLLIPLGVYLRYYLSDRSKWYYAVIIGFFVSLFFEITQRTGLFGIFACPYRLFDVDDLILNTLGSTLGYFLAPMILFFIPNKEKIQAKDLQYRDVQQATYGIQLIELLINVAITKLITGIFVSDEAFALFYMGVFSVVLLLFIVVMPLMTNGATIGGAILRVRTKRGSNFLRNLMKRYFIVVLPYLFSKLALSMAQYTGDDTLMILLGFGLWLSSMIMWLVLFLHIVVKWMKKAPAPFFNDFAELLMERVEK